MVTYTKVVFDEFKLRDTLFDDGWKGVNEYHTVRDLGKLTRATLHYTITFDKGTYRVCWVRLKVNDHYLLKDEKIKKGETISGEFDITDYLVEGVNTFRIGLKTSFLHWSVTIWDVSVTYDYYTEPSEPPHPTTPEEKEEEGVEEPWKWVEDLVKILPYLIVGFIVIYVLQMLRELLPRRK